MTLALDELDDLELLKLTNATRYLYGELVAEKACRRQDRRP